MSFSVLIFASELFAMSAAHSMGRSLSNTQIWNNKFALWMWTLALEKYDHEMIKTKIKSEED